MNTHRIKILDRTNNNAVVSAISNDLHFILFPADNTFLDQEFRSRRCIKSSSANCLIFFGVVGDSPTATPKGERRSNDRRKTDLLKNRHRIVHRMRKISFRDIKTNCLHRYPETIPILRFINCIASRPDHFDAKFFEHTMSHKI